MRTLLPLALLPTLACGPSVAEEMERALQLSNDAIAVSLLASEGAAWIDVTRTGFNASWPSELGVRHDPPGDCPKISRDPSVGEPFTMDATYTGCVSGSRLTPTILQGVLGIDGTIDDVVLDFSALAVNYRTPTGDPLEAVHRGGDRVYAIDGAISFAKDPLLAALDAELHITVDHTEVDEVAFAGHVLLEDATGAGRIDLDRVVIALDDIPGECAVPYTGSARMEGKPEIEVDFTDANADGKVLVRRRSRESTPTRLCSFASDVL